MKYQGKTIGKPDFEAPPKDGVDHPLYDRAVETGQRAERPEPRVQPYTSRDKQIRYLLKLREQHKAAGTWNPEWDVAWGIEGLE